MFNSVLSVSVTPRYHQEKLEAVTGVPSIERGNISLNHRAKFLSKKVLYMSIKLFHWWSAIFFSLGLIHFSIAEIKVANSYRFLHFSSNRRSRYYFMMKTLTGMCYSEWLKFACYIIHAVHPLDVTGPMCSIEAAKNTKLVWTFLDWHICRPLLVITICFGFWL